MYVLSVCESRDILSSGDNICGVTYLLWNVAYIDVSLWGNNYRKTRVLTDDFCLDSCSLK